MVPQPGLWAGGMLPAVSPGGMPDLSWGFDHAGLQSEITSPLQNPEVIKKAALRSRVFAGKYLPVFPSHCPVSTTALPRHHPR